MSQAPSIAVIGGGFSGAMLAVQLARLSHLPLRVRLYDKTGRFARGVAYGTLDPAHLLNVPAGKMGALAQEPGHFYDWLQRHEATWRALDPAFARMPYDADSFMPRMIFGAYVASLLAEAESARGMVRIERVAREVVDVEKLDDGRFRLEDAAGETTIFDRLALATGNLTARERAFERDLLGMKERYIAAFWTFSEQDRERLLRTPAAPVAIIGTGLTMVDAVLSLRRAGHQGAITAFSRHGLLPLSHEAAQAWPPFVTLAEAPERALDLLRLLRREARQAKERGGDWRAVIDALRFETPALWRRLPVAERRKLLRLLAFWSVHRHRMPPESAQMLAREQALGSLRVLAGHLAKTVSRGETWHLTLRRRPPLSPVEIEAAHVINCTGPELNPALAQSALFERMGARGLITPHPLGLGAMLDADYRTRGIETLGGLRLGEALECTAVPELREQALALAAKLCASFKRA